MSGPLSRHMGGATGAVINDVAARRRALDPARSFIVQAPAGSGKTGLLVQRLLVLLATVTAPEQVVAITFTRKAAGEMRARVAAALLSAKGPAPESAHERVTWELARTVVAWDNKQGWGLLDHPGRLRIQTFDSLCAAIARQMPYLSKSGGENRVTESAFELYREAAQRTVRHLDGGGWAAGPGRAAAVADLLAHLDNHHPRVVDLLADMLARRDHWLDHLVTDDPAALIDDLESSLGRLVSDTLARAAATLCDEVHPDELAELIDYASGHLATGDTDKAALADALTAWSPTATGPETLDSWRGIAELLLTLGGTVRKSVTAKVGFPPASALPDAEAKAHGKLMKGRMTELLGGIDPESALVDHLSWVRALPTPIYPADQRRILSALVTVLPLAVAELTLVFAEHGAVDFPQVAQSALTALGPEDFPTDLGLSLDFAIHHLLVDEFQDTSKGQFKLLERLVSGWQPGDGNSLFLVGDPMQSIYRFREAEVGLFLRARRRGIGPVVLENLLLSTNFRSRPAVVDWVNRGFVKIFPATEEITRGAVSYAPCRAGVKGGMDDTGGVDVHPMAARDDAAEAALVCELIHTARTANPDARIAILVRSRSHLGTILPAMGAAGIGFRAVDIAALGRRPAVADLISLTRALMDPADRIAWLAVLRAPWCGLPLADLCALVGNDRKFTVAQCLADPERVDSLSDDGRRRVIRTWMVLSRALNRRGRMRLSPWVEQTWKQLWGPATVAPDDLPDTVRYLNLLDGLDGGGEVPSLGRLMERVSDLYAADASVANVEVMTIHKAKGLEFDTVIVPGLGRGSAKDDSPLLQWLERTLEGEQHANDAEPVMNLLMAAKGATGEKPDRLYRYLKKIQGEREAFERQRLLYVAATRARTRLHLIGHARFDDKNGWQAPGGSLLNILWPAVGEVFDRLDAESPETAEQIPAPDHPIQPIYRLPLDFAPPAPADPVSAPLPPTEGDGKTPTYDWAGELARHVGTVVHRAMQRIALDGLENWDVRRVAAYTPRFATALADLGLPRGQHKNALQRILTALGTTLGSERGRWLLGPRDEGSSELPVSGLLNGKIAHRVIDRTFVDGGVRWIVDFKTGVHSGDVDAFLNEEQRRYSEQLKEYATLMAALDDRPIRLGLYFPLMDGWREWDLRSADSCGVTGV